MSTISEYFGLGSSYSKEKVPLFGVECEIESIRAYTEIEGILIKEDNSLRNSGREFVWERPYSLERSVSMFTQLHREGLRFVNPDDKFSERTSTHVHLNCRNLTPEQTKTLILLYAIYEEIFFAYVDPSRRDNIHCVALTETHLPMIYKELDFIRWVSAWHKYTALNLKRLVDLGTVEFRHLEGTDSPEKLKNWLITLGELWSLCQKVCVTKETLTPENLQAWGEVLFKHWPMWKQISGNLYLWTENTVIDVKLSFVS